jgi:hypothetical protein
MLVVKKAVIILIVAASAFAGLAGPLIGLFWGALHASTKVLPENLTPGVVIQQAGIGEQCAAIEEVIRDAPAGVMKRSGLVGAMGGAHFKLTAAGSQEVMLPVPQLADGQVPVCYFIHSAPPDAAEEFRLRKRDASNVVLSIRLAGGNRKVELRWSSVVLVTREDPTPNATPPDAYREATACVQAKAEEISQVATDLWRANGSTADFAANIQQFIRAIKRKAQPRSLDALGIYRSGENGICTANANLAAAVLRAKGIASRTMAVIPSTSDRLEMHRIVEFFDENRWRPFDPSSLHPDIPTKPWQNIIMAKTTGWDEEVSMKLRMGAMAGCPYGQEAEMLSAGVSLWGQDFFWTQAKPLAEFEPPDAAVELAVASWNRYLENGALTQGQIKAASATNADEFAEDLRTK